MKTVFCNNVLTIHFQAPTKLTELQTAESWFLKHSLSYHKDTRIHVLDKENTKQG